MTYILGNYERAWENVLCSFRDSCATNKTLANRTKVPLACRARHRFNLRVETVLQKNEVLLEKINKEMQKLKKVALSAKIFKDIGYRPKTRNFTCWSSAVEMDRGYTQVFDAVKELHFLDFHNLLLTMAQARRQDTRISKLKDVQ